MTEIEGLTLVAALSVVIGALACIGACVNWWVARNDPRRLTTTRGQWIARSVRFDDLVRIFAYASITDRGLATIANLQRPGFLITAQTWRSSLELFGAGLLFAIVSFRGWWRRWLLMSGRK